MTHHAVHRWLPSQALRPEPWVIGGFMLAAVVSGAVIASENLMLMALMGGALASAILLSMPAIAVWLVLLGTLVIAGPLVFNFPNLHRIPWLFSVLGIFLSGAALLHAGLGGARQRGPTPAFVLVAALFMVYALASTLWGSIAPLGDEAAGARRMFQYWGVLFALACIPFAPATLKRWQAFIVLLAVCQFPLVLYQRIVIHPTLLYNATLDAVVGTFEAPFTGGSGSSGVLAFMQIVIGAGLLAAYREGLLKTWAFSLTLLAVFLPLAIGETNVMFIWLPLALCCVCLDVIRRRPAWFLAWAGIATLLMVGFAAIYLVVQQSQTGPIMSPEQKLQELYDYNLGNLGYGNATNLNRASVIPYWFKHHGLNDPVASTFGHGLASAFSGGESRTRLVLQHADRSIDLLGITGVLWELGLVGAALYLTIFGLAWRSAYRLSLCARPGWDRAVARTLLACMTLLLSLAFYSNALSTTATQQVLAMLAMGMIAAMERRYYQGQSPLMRRA